MRFNPFNKKDTTTLPTQVASPNTPPPQSKPIRGPDGKFTGKKENKKVEKEEKQSDVVQVINNSKFGGIPIRRTFTQGKWFFVIEDVVALASVPDVRKYLNQNRLANTELNENWEEMTQKIVFSVGDKEEELECADGESILNIVRALDKPLPGPFSRWLQETSKKIPI